MAIQLDPAAVEAFRTDGAAVLRGVLSQDWLDRLAEGVEHNRNHPSKYGYQYTQPPDRVGFWADYVTWQDVPAYRDAVFNSGLAAVARELMGSQTSRFFHEHILVKEAGTAERTPWHHDQPYYCVDGDQSVSMWIPLDPVPEHAALQFVAGSHRWNRWFVPRKFINHEPYAPEQDRWEHFPAESWVETQPLITCPADPGDIVVFHYRTLHGAPGTEGLSTARRAVSLRWIGDDATFALRPWLHSPPFEQLDLVEGGPLDDDRFPLVV